MNSIKLSSRDLFNKTTGDILRNNRKRSKLSISAVCSQTTHIKRRDLFDFEDGKRSPRGYQLYELLTLYRDTTSIDEKMFFCIHPKLHKDILSHNFLYQYSIQNGAE